jgi:hypothetical protein
MKTLGWWISAFKEHIPTKSVIFIVNNILAFWTEEDDKKLLVLKCVYEKDYS